MTEWKLYAAPMSYFSAKTRPLLRYKKLRFVEHVVNDELMERVIHARTGRRFIPVVVTDTDEVLQDTPRILERIEALVPEPRVIPQDPALRLLAEVFQDFTDEMMVPLAVDWRWGRPEQHEWLFADWTSSMGAKTAAFGHNMIAALPMLGVSEGNRAVFAEWYLDLLDLLERHFAASRFLLGDRLGMMDLALAGPFYAHLGRDPIPARIMRERAPRVMAWVHETNDAAPPAPWAADFEIRETLWPLLNEIGRTFVPMQMAVTAFAEEAARVLVPGTEFPRLLGVFDQPVLGHPTPRIANSYAVWRHKRTAGRFAALAAADARRAEQWLRRCGAFGYVERIPDVAIRMNGFELEVG